MLYLVYARNKIYFIYLVIKSALIKSLFTQILLKDGFENYFWIIFNIYSCKLFNSLLTYFDVLVLIRLNRLNDEFNVEFRISKPPPLVGVGTIVIGKDDGSLIMLSIESGSSSITPGRIKSFSLCSSRRNTMSSCDFELSFGDLDNFSDVGLPLFIAIDELTMGDFDGDATIDVLVDCVVETFSFLVAVVVVGVVVSVVLNGAANASSSLRNNITLPFFLFFGLAQ